MDFIREITEARMTRTQSQTEKLSYLDCCERAYLILLSLELMRQFPDFERKTIAYARNTARYTGYDYFRMNATDLYNFLYFATGNDKALERLRDPEDAKQARQRTHVPIMAINRYLSKLGAGQTPSNVSAFFMEAEKSMRVNNSSYKSIRRVVTNFRKASNKDIRTATTRLLYAARAKLRSSDIINDLENLADERNLQSASVKDREPSVSKPDEIVTNKDLVFLQKIVGKDKLFLAIKYIELAQEGKTIPSNVARAMTPAIDLVVDLVKGGPEYVERLLQLQKRAKSQRKRRKR